MRRRLPACIALTVATQLACGPTSDAARPSSERSEVTLAITPPEAAPARSGPTPANPSASSAAHVRPLTSRELAELDAQLRGTLSPCPDQPVSLKQCVDEARACAACGPASDFLTRLVRQGVSRSDRESLHAQRFDADKVVTIDVTGSPALGPAKAPVTLVEWVDFQCGHCAAMSLVLGLAMERFPGQIRWVQKTYVLPLHELEPALAGAAAAKLGKYWEMHTLMFANQTALSRGDLVRHAVTAGLDKGAFEKQMKSADARRRVEEDMKQADKLGMEGTPMLYINGRKVPLASLIPFPEELFTWIADDIRMRGMMPMAPSPRYQAMAKELGLE